MRIAKVKLRDVSQLLPMPDRGGRLFRAHGETVDVENPFWLGLLAEGGPLVLADGDVAAGAGGAAAASGRSGAAEEAAPEAKGGRRQR